MPHVGLLIIAGWTTEISVIILAQGMWPFVIVNNKHCGRVEAFSFRIFMI